MSVPARALRVVDPGPLCLVQDAGRPGLAHLGVPRSGWLDDRAAQLSNRLVGNPEDAAVLECLLGGTVVRPSAAMAVAVTGARCPVTVGGRPAPHGAAVAVRAGEPVELGRPQRGARCYLAVAGGVRVPAVLGSRASDTLSGLGPPPVRAGTVLAVGPATGAPSAAEQLRPAPRPVLLRLHPGPRTDWFEPGALGRLRASAYTVGAAADRVALRLTGPTLRRVVEGELPSEGLVLGAVQVPGDGQPLVFLNDHPTTGGYPVIGIVERADLELCAQVLPGEEVRFTVTGRGREREAR